MGQEEFVGRRAELEALAEWAAGPTPSVAYIHGVGGIGKSTLVRTFARQNSSLNIVHMDATSLPGTSAELREAARDAVLVIDNVEQIPGTADMLRDQLAHQLTEGSRLIIVSRDPPSLRWRAEFGALFRSVELGELNPHDATDLLRHTNVPQVDHAALVELCHGHPLLLLLAAQIPGIGALLAEGLETAPNLVEALVELFGGLPREQLAADAFVICAIARRTTEPLLQAALDVEPRVARSLFEELRTKHWIRADEAGLFPHNLVRDAIRADSKWRDRSRYDRLFRRVARYCTDQLRAHGAPHISNLTFLLVDNPVYRRITAHRHGVVPGPLIASDDIDLVEEMLGPHFDEVSRRHLRSWHALGAIEVDLLYGPDGAPSEVACILDQTHLLETATDDPVVLAAREIIEGFDLRQDSSVLFSRLHGARESGQRSPLSNSRLMTAALQRGLQTPSLAAIGSVLHPPEMWRPLVEQGGATTHYREVEVDGTSYIVQFQDLRVLGAAGWVEAQLYPAEVEALSNVAVLDFDEFRCAVREALKVLAGKKGTSLAQCRLACAPFIFRAAADVSDPARAAALERCLKSEITAVEDERVSEVLRLTYLEPAVKQFAAAVDLGLSFSTFRRALAAGVDELTEALWQREVEASV